MYYYYLLGAGMEPRALCMLGKCSTTELHTQLLLVFKKRICLYRDLSWEYTHIYVGHIIFMEGHKNICANQCYIESPQPLRNKHML